MGFHWLECNSSKIIMSEGPFTHNPARTIPNLTCSQHLFQKVPFPWSKTTKYTTSALWKEAFQRTKPGFVCNLNCLFNQLLCWTLRMCNLHFLMFFFSYLLPIHRFLQKAKCLCDIFISTSSFKLIVCASRLCLAKHESYRSYYVIMQMHTKYTITSIYGQWNLINYYDLTHLPNVVLLTNSPQMCFLSWFIYILIPCRNDKLL